MLKKVQKPLNPYDPAWAAYWEENPHLNRGVGADGVNDDDGGDDNGDKGGEDPTDKAKAPADDGGADGGSESDKSKGGDGKPTDAEAKLLKEVMDKKDKLKKTAEELATVKETLKKFEGIDLDQVQKLMEQQQQAEQKKLEDKGEWDKLRAQMVDQHNKTVSDLNKRIKELEDGLGSKDGTINELTIGHSFDASDFIKNDLTLTPTKARIIYGNHFEVQDGKIVAYDKASGSDRTILVDGEGNPLAFNEAIKKIVDSDPDRDHIVKSKAKPGSDSKPKDKAKDKQPELRGQSKIAAALNSSGGK